MTMSLLEYFSQNSIVITTIATAIVALSAVVTAVLTGVLAVENRRLRKAGVTPEVAAYLAPHPDGNGGVNFVLANIGQGPALNVKFSLACDESDFEEHDVKLRNDLARAPLTILPQGEKIGTLFGVGYVLFGADSKGSGKILKPFEVIISYSDLSGRLRKNTQSINISQFSGLAGLLAKPALREIADSVGKIERHLGKVAQQSSRFATLIDATTMEQTYRNKAKGSAQTSE